MVSPFIGARRRSAGLPSLIAIAAVTCAPAALWADEPPAEAMAHANALSRAFRYAAERATPSVVVVRSEMQPTRQQASPRGREGRGQENPFKGTPFEDFFRDGVPEGFEFGPGMPGPGGRGRSGVGSGVIIDSSGIVLTNNHVVEGADSVTVELSDGREFKAVEIKTDPESDLAVVKLADANGLPVARLGDSDKLDTGDWVIAIGNPFELETTVSAGIISGKGRELDNIRRAKFLQTDAAINPGNSGGPLVNLAGEVIGINTAIASNNGGYQGIGFAIPVNLAKWVSGQLIAKGKVERAWLGVSIGPVEGAMAKKLGVRRGVLVTEVMPGSPAARAGVEELDVITAFDGTAVDGPRTLQEVVERATTDRSHTLAVFRDGRKVNLEINVAPLPDRLASGMRQRRQPQAERDDSFYSEDFGLAVRDKASMLKDGEQDPFEGVDGVLVERVDADGIAAECGLGPGMLIRKVGRTAIGNVGEFAAAVERASPEDGVMLQVRTSRGNAVLLLKKPD
ncbi:MAG: Do family serine endopeptidase [Planctomycetaceae bacterium]